MTQSTSSKPGLIHGLGLVSIVIPMAASAQSTWNGGTSVNWNVAANWSPGIPAEGSNIIIADTTTNGLTLNDASHAVGSITVGTTGTRVSGFTLQTNTANTLTINGGVTANGNFTAGIGARLRGNLLIAAAQTWQVGGEIGSHSVDRGIAINEVSAGNLGTLTLNANLNKSGTGQLTLGATTVGGAGDINVNEGSLKLNAGGNLQLTIGGTGKLALNNSAALFLSKNSGSFNSTTGRLFQFNNTSRLETGSGTNNLAAGPYDIVSNMEWNGIHTITNNQNANAAGNVNYRFTGVMSGTGSITKNGVSQLTLTGSSANTLSGQVTVAAGELSLDKTGVIAVPGNILVTGGTLRINQAQQIADTSGITVTGGAIAVTADRPETIASLNISSPTICSVSGFTVTGATTLSNGVHQLNSGQTFTTNSLSLSNNAALQLVGAAAVGFSSTVNVGAGGLNLNTGRVLYGNPGNTTTTQVNLSGNVVSSGTSLFSAANYNGFRILDLQAGSRSFAVNDGTLDIRTTVENGTLVKSGAGTLILSQPGSTANFSFTDGPVQIATQANASNVALSGGSLLMDVGGATPAKLTTTGNFDVSGGTIELSANNGNITPGTLQLISYGGTLTGTPTINIPPQLAASRMNPVVNMGTGTNSSITLTSTAVPLALTWQGATGGVWDNNTTANFNGGAEKFYPLDSVTFDDTGSSSSILLNSVVFPADVTFNHSTVPTYTLTGAGSISGPTKLTKDGTGTTILTTDNNYTGITDILAGTLNVGNGGLTGSLGTGAVQVASGATLAFARDGVAVVPNAISGSGAIVTNGPGTVAFTANSTFAGTIGVTGGTLQFGNGGADGTLGTSAIDIAAGATFAIKRTGAPTISNSLSGAGSLAVIGGTPILTGINSHTGGVSVSGDGTLYLPADSALGEIPLSPIANAIRLDHGGLKNQDSLTSIDSFRGVSITGEAYFTAGWTKSLTIGGPITGTGNVFINYDSGRVIFSDTTSNWNGILTLGANKPGFNGTTGGILEINTINNSGAAGTLGTASADPANLVFNGGRLVYTGDTAASNRGFTLQGAGTLDVISSATALTMSGQATGPGALTKVGDGTVVLTGANDFAGNVVVDDGTLSLTHTSALGATAKTLVIAGDANTSRIPEVQLSGGISPAVADLDISGAGVGNLTGALHNVSGDNTLTVTNDVTMRTGNGGTTLYSAAGTLTINTPLVSANTTGRVLTLAGDGNGVINGVIANGTTAALPVIKNGNGTWTLNGAHTYTGATTVNAGVLSLGQAALSDTAAVAIASGAALNLNFTGIDRVGSLTIDGVAKADGVYDASTDPGFITGTGSVRVGPEPSGYGTWASGYPFTVGVNDGPEQDADGDGISNVLEYVLGGVPVGTGASNTSILPTYAVTNDNVVFTFRRSDSSETDVTLKVQWSDTMGTWNDFATIGAGDALPAVDVTEDSPSAELDTVTVTIPKATAPGGKLFVRLQAIKN